MYGGEIKCMGGKSLLFNHYFSIIKDDFCHLGWSARPGSKEGIQDSHDLAVSKRIRDEPFLCALSEFLTHRIMKNYKIVVSFKPVSQHSLLV